MNNNMLRRRIIGAAAECFLKYGIKNTSMNFISEILHISKRTLYRAHLKVKRDLLKACIPLFFRDPPGGLWGGRAVHPVPAAHCAGWLRFFPAGWNGYSGTAPPRCRNRSYHTSSSLRRCPRAEFRTAAGGRHCGAAKPAVRPVWHRPRQRRIC